MVLSMRLVRFSSIGSRVLIEPVDVLFTTDSSVFPLLLFSLVSLQVTHVAIFSELSHISLTQCFLHPLSNISAISHLVVFIVAGSRPTHQHLQVSSSRQ